MTDVTTTADLLVAGAGPIGLATAVEAAQAGLDVVVLDPRHGPIDKACGEGLMPAARASLMRLGVFPQGREFHGIRYRTAGPDGAVAEAPFRDGPGLGVRRTALSSALDARAAELGVKRVVGAATPPVVRGGRVTSGGVSARWLVAADGLHSPVRRWVGLDPPGDTAAPAVPPRFGLRRHYRVQPWSDVVEVFWARDCEAYVTPVADDLVGVAILCPGGPVDTGGAGYDAWLSRFPALQERLRCNGAEPVGAVRGAGPLRQDVPARVRGRTLLVGDAAGYVDALTGEGISIGLASARELVACLVADRPQDYEAAWQRVTRRYRTLTGTLLWAARRPALRRTIVPAASALPPVFTGIVNALG